MDVHTEAVPLGHAKYTQANARTTHTHTQHNLHNTTHTHYACKQAHTQAHAQTHTHTHLGWEMHTSVRLSGEDDAANLHDLLLKLGQHTPDKRTQNHKVR